MKQLIKRLCTIGAIVLAMPFWAFAETVGVFHDTGNEQMKFAAGDVKTALEAKGFTVEMLTLSSLTTTYANKKVVIALVSNTAVTNVLTSQSGSIPTGLGEQAYGLRTTTSPQKSYWALGGDLTGAMYGGIEIAENISSTDFTSTLSAQETPTMINRGMKYDLPLDKTLPTYVGAFSATSAQKAIKNVWDINFWKTLIDQQARFRYNVLSVWVHHPFPALVKLTEYPNICLPKITDWDGTTIGNFDHTARVAFWRSVMQYAHDRGMKFYFFNWNIHLEGADGQYGITESISNSTTKTYMYKSMTALLQTYPELDGFGISAGDGMTGTDAANAQWTYDAMGKAVYDYFKVNTTRKFNLIHRSIGTTIEDWNTKFAPLKTLSNVKSDFSVKYTYAHMYCITNPGWDATKQLPKLAPMGAKSYLTLRSDDYFYLSLGDHQFVRDFINQIPYKSDIAGYYIGADENNPTRTYFCKNSLFNGKTEVERRWYMEMLWGRLGYNPNVSDDVIKRMISKKYPTANSTDVFNAWAKASKSLPMMTQLIMKTWFNDFQWYPEACYSDPESDNHAGGFKTIDLMASESETTIANNSNLCTITASAAGTCASDKKSSYILATEMIAAANEALALANTLSSGGNAELQMTIDNIKQNAYLSGYYGYKIRGATYKKAGQTANARAAMSEAYCWWKNYSTSMDNMYNGDTFRDYAVTPDWKFLDAAVLKEYTLLGGSGTPSCTTGDPVPVVAFTGNPTTLLQGNTVTFTDQSANTPTSWAWSFPGGTPATSTLKNPVVTYNTAGVYNVSLTATNTAGSGSLTKAAYITVNGVPPSSESIPWNESFTFPNGTTSDVAPTSWTATNMSVQNNEISFNKVGADGELTTGVIDISSGPVTVSVKIRGGGGLDLNQDFLKLFKKVDGGPEVEIGFANGLVTVPSFTADVTSGSNLVLVLRAHVTSTTEYYYFDDLSVISKGETPTYTITATAGANGSISPIGIVPVVSGANQSFTITPSNGYILDVLTVDGSAVSSPANPYVFTNVVANHTIHATFKLPDGPDPDVTAITNWVPGNTNVKVSGSNRMLVVMAMGESTSVFSASSATYGGQTMTRVTDKYITNGSTTYCAMFTLKEAGVNLASSNTINVVWSATPSAGFSIYSVLLSNVDQTATITKAFNGLATATTITSSALAAASGDMVVMCGATANNNTQTFDNGFSKQFESNSSWGDGVGGFKMGTGVNETPGFTQSSSGRMVICAIVAKKATSLKSNENEMIVVKSNDDKSVVVYPNPTKGIINIESGSESSKQINVFNTIGEMVYSTKTNNSSIQLDLQSFNLKGIVMIQVINDNKVSNHKVQFMK